MLSFLSGSTWGMMVLLLLLLQRKPDETRSSFDESPKATELKKGRGFDCRERGETAGASGGQCRN